jgi:predicted site-specific integrase-resolvase
LKFIMLVGYVRVSKNDGTQTLSPQLDAMLAAGVEPSRIYEDLASGRKDDRPGLNACLKALQPGNTLVVWKLDRLGRDLKHLVKTLPAPTVEKGKYSQSKRQTASFRDSDHDGQGNASVTPACSTTHR